MDTTILKDGTKQHKIKGWIGLQKPNEPMTKTKWRRTDLEYFNVNGYTQVRNKMGSITCTCKGFYFRKKCRHINELKGDF